MRQDLIERASAIDLMELASATTPAAGQVGALLVLEPGVVGLAAVRSALGERIVGVARLRQRLRSTPLGCGRPIWIDDAGFDLSQHVREVACPPPGDRSAVLEVAADLVAQPLPRGRPWWTATLVTGVAGGASALVIVFHHVLADGMGGLAMLAHLVDGAPPTMAAGFPRPAPSTAMLLGDAVRSRLRAPTRSGRHLARLRAGGAELGARPSSAPRSSLNAPVGSQRCLAVADTTLAAIHTAARRHGVSVNDAVLAAITGALRGYLADRGECLDDVVVSIPVSSRGAATAAELGNRIGIMTVRLPCHGLPAERMRAIGAVTSTRKHQARGASAALVAPVFRVLAATGTLRWFTEHQRLVTTFVTNLRGPEVKVRFLERTVEELIPLGSTSGNVRVAFGIFSYAGTLTVTVVADAALAPQLDDLVGQLQDQLHAVAAPSGPDERDLRRCGA